MWFSLVLRMFNCRLLERGWAPYRRLFFFVVIVSGAFVLVVYVACSCVVGWVVVVVVMVMEVEGRVGCFSLLRRVPWSPISSHLVL